MSDYKLSADEKRVMDAIRTFGGRRVPQNLERLTRASEQYGPLDFRNDRRDFLEEAIEELVDARFYIVCASLSAEPETVRAARLTVAMESVNDALAQLATLAEVWKGPR